MKKLADISMFEGIQKQANAGFVSDLSVFNRVFTDEGGEISDEALEALHKLNAKDLPVQGMGKAPFEKILVGVNKIIYRYFNDGDVLNSVEDYAIMNDDDLLDDVDSWLKDRQENEYNPDTDDGADYPYGLRDLDKSEIPMWVEDYLNEDDNYKNYDSEDLNWLDDYVDQVVSVNPEYSIYFYALRDAQTDGEYVDALNDLIWFTVDDLNTRWHFADIPKDEMKSWFKK